MTESEVPLLGSVHGFRFSFGEQDLRYPHPGIIVMARLGTKGTETRCGVIALAITHATQHANWDEVSALRIPVDELSTMGLDAAAHWICLFEQTVAYYPQDTKWISGAGGAHLGQASDGFTRHVIEAWGEYRQRQS